MNLILPLMLASLSVNQPPPIAETVPTPIYELRIYTAAEGKLDALNTRFRDHTVKLFTKHGITNLGYWTPIDNEKNQLIYLLSYPSMIARKTSWEKFVADPEWQAAYAASETEGKLTTKVENVFLQATTFSPEVTVEAKTTPRIFEMRTYTTTPGNLVNLHKRFSDHTIELFAKHGMTNLWYFELVDDAQRKANTLIYFLAHDSVEARDKSFAAFRNDPQWKAALAASEKNAGGPLTAENGVQSVLMKPTDYSPMK